MRQRCKGLNLSDRRVGYDGFYCRIHPETAGPRKGPAIRSETTEWTDPVKKNS